MQTLDLNLASRPFRNNTLLWLAYTLATVLIGAFAFLNVQSYHKHAQWLVDLRQQVSTIDNQLAELERRDRAARLEIERFDMKSLTLQAQKANDVIQWKAFSWTELFNLLEQIQPDGVRMTSVHPVFRGESDPSREQTVNSRARAAARESQLVPVAVEGLAKDLHAFVDLERALQNHPHFARVEPESIARTENSGETAFQLRFHYDPRGGQARPAAAPDAEQQGEAATAEAEPPAEQPGDGADSRAGRPRLVAAKRKVAHAAAGGRR